MTQVSVRFGTEKDLPFIVELSKASCEASIPPNRSVSLEAVRASLNRFMTAWPKLSANYPLKTLILENSETGEPIGYLLLMLDQAEGTTGELQAVIQDGAISPGYRGKYLWLHLMKKAEDLARERKNSYLVGYITMSNKTSLTLAKRYGFVVERVQVSKKL